MPFKNKGDKAEYMKRLRERWEKGRICVRCGTPLIDSEGKCCVNCTSWLIKNMVSLKRGNI